MIYDVTGFMAAAGQIDLSVRQPDAKLLRLQLSLMLEELSELSAEIPECFTELDTKRFTALSKKLRKPKKNDPLSTATCLTDLESNARLIDHFIDIIWVTLGGLISTGCDAPKAWNEVVRANMDKFHKCTPDDACYKSSADGEYCSTCNDTGYIAVRDKNNKVVKPDDWVAPELKQFCRVI
jgi:predicted HAD superfamily Cof-like phosphohydrolase